MSSSGQLTSSMVEGEMLGIIGGSGMCTFPELRVISRHRPNTRYGMPSDDILICDAIDLEAMVRRRLSICVC